MRSQKYKKYGKKRRSFKKMRGGDPPRYRISNRQLQSIVNNVRALIGTGTRLTAEAFLIAFVAETIRELTLDPRTSMIANEVATLLGSYIRIMINSLGLTGKVTLDMILRALNGTASTMASITRFTGGLLSAALNTCRTFPILSTAVVTATSTAAAMNTGAIGEQLRNVGEYGPIETFVFLIARIASNMGVVQIVDDINERHLLTNPQPQPQSQPASQESNPSTIPSSATGSQVTANEGIGSQGTLSSQSTGSQSTENQAVALPLSQESPNLSQDSISSARTELTNLLEDRGYHTFDEAALGQACSIVDQMYSHIDALNARYEDIFNESVNETRSEISQLCPPRSSSSSSAAAAAPPTEETLPETTENDSPPTSTRSSTRLSNKKRKGPYGGKRRRTMKKHKRYNKK